MENKKEEFKEEPKNKLWILWLIFSVCIVALIILMFSKYGFAGSSSDEKKQCGL